MISCSHWTRITEKSFPGNLREQVELARRITEEQKAVFVKLRRAHMFFGSLEAACGAVEDVRMQTVSVFLRTLTILVAPSVH